MYRITKYKKHIVFLLGVFLLVSAVIWKAQNNVEEIDVAEVFDGTEEFDTGARTMSPRAVAQGDLTITGSWNWPDDTALNLGTSDDTNLLWETADANANLALMVLPEGGATNVPGFVVGDTTALDLDLGLFNGKTHPFIATLADGGPTSTYIYHTGADGAIATTEGNLYLVPGGADVNIGTGALGGGDLFFNTPADGTAKFSYREGGSGASEVYTAFSGGFDQYGYFVGDTAGRQIVVADVAGRNLDFDHGARTDPHLYPHSILSPNTSNNQYGDISHDGENFVLSAGANVGTGTGATTDNNGISIAPLELTSGGTANFGLSVTRTLNDTGAAGGSDLYTHFLANMTQTDITGWDDVYLMDLQVGGTSQFLVEDDGNLTTTGGQIHNRTAVDDAAYSILLDDYIIAYTAISAERIITLPTVASAGAGKVYHIVDESGDAGNFNIVIEGNGAETISGALNQTISVAYNTISVYCSGSAWYIY